MGSLAICMFTLSFMTVITHGQINRFINPAWLEMDANSEYYPGGEVISQILRAYGLGDNYDPPRHRSFLPIQNGYRRLYPRNRIVNNLQNIYDSDPLSQEYFDQNNDYIDNTIRNSYRYRNNLADVTNPRRTRINLIPLSRNTYYPSEYMDRDSPLLYSRSRLTGISDSDISQESILRSRDSGRLIPRSTVAPDGTDPNKKQKI